MFVEALPRLLADRPAGWPSAWRWVGIARSRLLQWLCGLYGHDMLMHTSRNRMFLECVTCGHQTPGWQVDVRVLSPTRRRKTA